MRETLRLMIQVDGLKREGLTAQAIAERTGLHRQTVAKYLAQLEQARDQGTPLETIATRGRRRCPIDPYVPYLHERLTTYPELTAERLYQEVRAQGFPGARRTVRRYVAQWKTQRPQRVYRPYETGPGEQAQVDWGHEWGEHGGQKTKIYSFVFVLAYSRLRYVEYVPSLDSVRFLNCLWRAFDYCGGVPQTVLFDNAKVIVSERVGHVIRFQADLLALAARLRFRPAACWVEDPETKGKVESTVGYVHRDFFYGATFPDLATLNQQARQWCDRVNRQVHATTQVLPVDRLRDEQPRLTPLPAQHPPLFRVQPVRVTKTSCFTFQQNQYSVPQEYARRTLRLEIYEHEFRALAGEQEVGRWPRTTARGQHFLEPAHYAGRTRPPHRAALDHRFRALCVAAPAYLEGLATARGPALREQMQQIVALAPEYTPAERQAAMERALAFQNFGYGPLHRILQRQRTAPAALPSVPGPRTADPARLPTVVVEQRDPSYYAQGGATWTTSSSTPSNG